MSDMHQKLFIDAGHGDGGALQALARLDEDVARALKTYGSPPDRSLPASFDTLARAIVGQQVSRTAASSIWNRMEAASLTHETVIANSSADVMMTAGLSRRKAEYLIHQIDEGAFPAVGTTSHLHEAWSVLPVEPHDFRVRGSVATAESVEHLVRVGHQAFLPCPILALVKTHACGRMITWSRDCMIS